MAKIGLCIEIFFGSLPYAERLKKARELGFTAYEFWFHDKAFDGKSLTPEKKDFDMLADMNAKLGMTATDFVFNHPDGGIVASLIDRKDREKLKDGLAQIIPLARKIGCTRLISGSGNRVPGLEPEAAIDNMTGALIELAPICRKEGITLIVEPFNSRVDHPDYFLDNPGACAEVLHAVNSPNVKMLYDIYHNQIMDGNVTAFIRENIKHIGHFHIAAVPGRHEPDTGELNYPFILKEIDRLGYTGYCGLEYWPTVPDAESLKRTLKHLAG
jgi:hydroxypyruvate isomerase